MPGVPSMDREWFRSDSVIVGDFRCAPADPRFTRPSVAWSWPSIAFPRIAIEFDPGGNDPFIADPATAPVFNTGQVYRRRAVDARGSCTEWIEVRPDLWADIVSRHNPAMADRARQGRPFDFSHAPIPARTYLAQRLLYERLAASRPTDPLAVEEAALDAVSAVVAAAHAPRSPARARRPSRLRPRRDAVDHVARTLWCRMESPPTLTQLADQVRLSPFHLCVVFKEETGSTIRDHLHRIRLRRALELLTRTDDRLCAIALQLGYASESHFSDAFHRHFAQRPGAFRRTLRGQARGTRH